MKQALPLATGLVTLYAMKVVGDRKWWGWLVGLLNQGLWFAFIIVFAAWGLLPLSLALTVIYARNLLRWRATPAMEPAGEYIEGLLERAKEYGTEREKRLSELLTHGGTVGSAAKGGRSGAPTDSPAEGNSGRRRAVKQGQITTVGRLRGVGEAVMLSGHRSFSPVDSVARDSQGLVKLTVVRPHGKISIYTRPDEPCRVLRAA